MGGQGGEGTSLPGLPFGVGFWVRLRTFTPSMTTRFWSRRTFKTVPCLPFSGPLMTSTLSPLRIVYLVSRGIGVGGWVLGWGLGFGLGGWGDFCIAPCVLFGWLSCLPSSSLVPPPHTHTTQTHRHTAHPPSLHHTVDGPAAVHPPMPTHPLFHPHHIPRLLDRLHHFLLVGHALLQELHALEGSVHGRHVCSVCGALPSLAALLAGDGLWVDACCAQAQETMVSNGLCVSEGGGGGELSSQDLARRRKGLGEVRMCVGGCRRWGQAPRRATGEEGGHIGVTTNARRAQLFGEVGFPHQPFFLCHTQSTKHTLPCLPFAASGTVHAVAFASSEWRGTAKIKQRSLESQPSSKKIDMEAHSPPPGTHSRQVFNSTKKHNTHTLSFMALLFLPSVLFTSMQFHLSGSVA